MELSKVYTAILTLAGIQVDNEDKIFTPIKGEPHYIKHGGKDIYIPTKKAASTAPLKNGLIFNPLNENVLAKKDVVFTKIADKVFADFNTILSTWVYAIAKLMEQNAEAGTNMSPSVLAIIKEVGEVPKDFAARMMMFAAACAESNHNNRYLAYKISSASKTGEKTFNKKCVVWSPYKKTMDALYTGEWSQKDDEKKRIAGAVLRKSDGKPFDRIVSLILPGLSTDSYTKDSLSQIAPTVDSFLKSVKAIVTDMSNFHDKVKTLEDFDWPDYDMSWVKFMDNVDKHTVAIRNMPNDCANVPVQEKEPEVSSVNLAAAQEKANSKLLRDSSNIPPWEEAPKAAPVASAAPVVRTSAPTLEDLLSGKAPVVAGPVSQAMRESSMNNAQSGTPSVASILGSLPNSQSFRPMPTQTLFSGSLTQNKYSPTQVAQVPSMTTMRYPGQGF